MTPSPSTSPAAYLAIPSTSANGPSINQAVIDNTSATAMASATRNASTKERPLVRKAKWLAARQGHWITKTLLVHHSWYGWWPAAMSSTDVGAAMKIREAAVEAELVKRKAEKAAAQAAAARRAKEEAAAKADADALEARRNRFLSYMTMVAMDNAVDAVSAAVASLARETDSEVEPFWAQLVAAHAATAKHARDAAQDLAEEVQREAVRLRAQLALAEAERQQQQHQVQSQSSVAASEETLVPSPVPALAHKSAPGNVVWVANNAWVPRVSVSVPAAAPKAKKGLGARVKKFFGRLFKASSYSLDV